MTRLITTTTNLTCLLGLFLMTIINKTLTLRLDNLALSTPNLNLNLTPSLARQIPGLITSRTATSLFLTTTRLKGVGRIQPTTPSQTRLRTSSQEAKLTTRLPRGKAKANSLLTPNHKSKIPLLVKALITTLSQVQTRTSSQEGRPTTRPPWAQAMANSLLTPNRRLKILLLIKGSALTIP